MADLLQYQYPFTTIPLHVHSMGRYNSAAIVMGMMGTPSATTNNWQGNNLAVYAPVSLPASFRIARFMVANGSNLTGTIDIGIYNAAGTLLLSAGGGVARANASAVQYVDVTDTAFQAGSYYLALVGSSTSGTYAMPSIAAAVRGRWCGFLQESLGSSTLPGTMTPVANTASLIPQFGFTQSATV